MQRLNNEGNGTAPCKPPPESDLPPLPDARTYGKERGRGRGEGGRREGGEVFDGGAHGHARRSTFLYFEAGGLEGGQEKDSSVSVCWSD